MATTSIHIAAAPEDVWAVLSDPPAYGHFVVGTAAVRDFDPAWPATGAWLAHTTGVPPLAISDTSTVLESLPGRRLALDVRMSPFGSARVDLTLNHQGAGTEVVMTESPSGGPFSIPGWRQLTESVMFVRNRETLRRLRVLAETRAREQASAEAVVRRTTGRRAAS